MASLLYFNGVDSVSISKRLGHAQVSTTANIYAHIIEEADKRMQIFYLIFSLKKRDFLYRVELLLNFRPVLNKKIKPCICRKWLKYKVFLWLRRKDLNQRPSGYEPDELPGCSTPRYIFKEKVVPETGLEPVRDLSPTGF